MYDSWPCGGWLNSPPACKKCDECNSEEYEVTPCTPTTNRVCKKCTKDWCKVETDNFSGWIDKSNLWGTVK